MLTLGIRDKYFLGKILRMLKAPVKISDKFGHGRKFIGIELLNVLLYAKISRKMESEP